MATSVSFPISYRVETVYTASNSMKVVYGIDAVNTVSSVISVPFTNTNNIYSVLLGNDLRDYIINNAPLGELTKLQSTVYYTGNLLAVQGIFTATTASNTLAV